MESILTSIKKMLGIEEEYTHFDEELIMYINSVLMGLTQIGVGPAEGYSIKDRNDFWADYLGNNTNLEAVKSYIYMKVRLIFDPPSSGFVLDSIERLTKEMEWRLNINVDPSTPYVPVTPTDPEIEESPYFWFDPIEDSVEESD